MKVLVIMGSPRRGNTYRACEEFRELMQKRSQADFEYVWLKDVDMRPCRGCFVCFPHGEGKCPNRDDDVAKIVRRMEEADGVVFASPVYSFNVSGLLKTFIDRISYMGHRPRLVGKKTFLIATSGGYGMKFPLKYLEKIVGQGWGMDVVGKVGLVTPNGDAPRHIIDKNFSKLRKAASRYSQMLSTSKAKRPSLMSMIIFHATRGAMSQLADVSPADFRYWTERGWLAPGVKYYIDVPVNPLFLGIAKLIGKVQSMKVKKDLKLPKERMFTELGHIDVR